MNEHFRRGFVSCVLIAALCGCGRSPENGMHLDPELASGASGRDGAESAGAGAPAAKGCGGTDRAATAGGLGACDARALAAGGAQSAAAASVAAAAGNAASSRNQAAAGARAGVAAAGSNAAGGQMRVASAAVNGSAAGGAAGAGAAASGRNAAGADARHDAAAGSGGVSSTAARAAEAFSACPTDGSACKIMPFGDSITDGYNQDTPGGYRIELFRRAHSAGKNITFVGSGSNGPEQVDGAPFPHNHEGHSGWTIAPAGGRMGISTLVSMVMPQYKPHIVLLMIGTNDAIDNYEMAKAPERLGQLIDSIYAQLPEVTIIVAQLIPARGASNQGDDAQLNARIQAFNNAIPALVDSRTSAGKHIFVVDMFTPYARDQSMSFEDQWHPNAAGYVLIGTTWYSALEPLL